MTQITDERLDLELVGFLHNHAEELYGAPDAGAMARRIAGSERSIRGLFARTLARPMVRVAIVGMLLAAAIGVTVLAGALRSGTIRNGLMVVSPELGFDPETGTYSSMEYCGGRCADAVYAFLISWSRDGRQMVFVDWNGLDGDIQTGRTGWSIWRYRADSSELTLINECPADGGCFVGEFSVDSRFVAFVETDWHPFEGTKDPPPGIGSVPNRAQPPTTWRLVAVDLVDGTRRQVEASTKVVPGAPHMSWTADGRVLLATQPGPSGFQVGMQLFDLDTGDVSEPVRRWPGAVGRVSPDGLTIAYVTYERPPRGDGIWRPEEHVPELWLSDVDGSNPRLVYHGDPREFYSGPIWSPDGTQVAVAGLGIIELATGNVRELSSGSVGDWLPAS
jgi:hypothetical protein